MSLSRLSWPRHSFATGVIPGGTELHKFGANTAVGTTHEMVWTPGALLTFLSVAETMLVTGGATDTAGGTGALTVTLQGLDVNYLEVEETVTMAGAGGVTTTQAFLRVFRMIVATAGASGFNDAILTTTASTSATVQAGIAAGKGQSQQAIWTVPAGCTLYLDKWGASIKKATGTAVRAADVDLHARKDGVTLMRSNLGLQNNGTGSLILNYEIPLAIAEKTDVWVEASASGANTDISAEFHGFYVSDLA